jgi:endogenous inhibitor of DNA gyrase (YacG/DUF329 family)
MKMQCPICKKVIQYPKKADDTRPPWLPFCSERCKLIDLGKWLDANYRIPAKVDENGNSDAEEAI